MKRLSRLTFFFAFGVVIVVMLSAGSAHAWDRSWKFANPSFNPNSLAATYLQFTAEATNPQEDMQLPDIEGMLDDVLGNVETLVFDIQSGIGNIGIDFPSTP